MANKDSLFESFAKDVRRDITPEDISFLNFRFAYIQIMNPFASNEFTEPSIVHSQLGWVIINYGNALSSSPGKLLFSNDNAGKGTHIKQMIDTDANMVRLAAKQNWPEIYIVDGHPTMKWGIWKAAQVLQLPVSGYSPSKEEEAKYRRIEKMCPTLLLESSTPKP